MTFDPFGDFETRGYLRNIARTKDSKIVRQMEHINKLASSHRELQATSSVGMSLIISPSSHSA